MRGGGGIGICVDDWNCEDDWSPLNNLLIFFIYVVVQFDIGSSCACSNM